MVIAKYFLPFAFVTLVTLVANAGPALPRLRTGDFTTRINGTLLWYRIAGRGPVMVMPSPGWGASSDLYFKSLTPLERRFTMIYLDTRGSGRSERPADTGAYRFGQFADDIDGLRAYLGLAGVGIIGHSMGGIIAMDYGIRFPQRLTSLLLIAAPPALDEELTKAQEAAISTKKGEPWYEAAMKGLAQEHPPMKSDQELERILNLTRPLYYYDPGAMKRALPQFEGTTYSAYAYNLVYTHPIPAFTAERLKKISAPTLAIASDGDLIVPPSQCRRAVSAIHGARMVTLAKAGHFPWLEQPESFYLEIERNDSSMVE